MQLSGNTVLITGGGTGIGRGLAEAFHKAGSAVVIAGRRVEVLKKTAEANPGMQWVQLDTGNPDDVKRAAAEVQQRFPALNVLVNNAGMARPENVLQGVQMNDVSQTIATNLTGVIGLTSALLPGMLKQKSAAVLNVTSGLAFVPLALSPTYCATKAALHSWTESLRYQLRNTTVEVIDIAPPYVQTELGGERQKTDPNAMPLEEYIQETVRLLEAGNLPAGEVLVERVKAMRFAERNGHYDTFFQQINERFAAERPNT